VDQSQFDTMTRTLTRVPSRRDVLRGIASAGCGLAALWLPGSTQASKKHKSADAKKKGKKRKQKRQNQTQEPPVAVDNPSSQSPTPPPPPGCTPNCGDRACGGDGCGGSCGTCGGNQVCQGGTCCNPEPRGATCAGRCGTWTNNCGQPVTCATCPAGQQCIGNGSCAIVCAASGDCPGGSGCSNPSVEGARHCIAGPLTPPVTCATTADCPPGSHCQDIGTKLCIELYT
jgi:hypothetical protein